VVKPGSESIGRSPGRHGHPPPPAPPPRGKTAEEIREERSLQLIQRAEEAIANLDAKIREARGLAKDMQANAKAYVEARGDLTWMMDELAKQKEELHEAVRKTLQRLVDTEMGMLQREMKGAFDENVERIKEIAIDLRDRVEAHQAKLLGARDPQEMMEEIAQRVARVMIRNMEESGGSDVVVRLARVAEAAEAAEKAGTITARDLSVYGGLAVRPGTPPSGTIRMGKNARKKS
jgi:hypothetical protein